MRSPLFFLCMLLLACPFALFAQPGSVLVQDGSGNTLSSHASIQEAYDAIPAPLTQPYVIATDSFYLARAPWENFPIRFTEKAGASAANTITLRRKNIHGFRTQFASRSDSTEIFVFDGADWITINGYDPDPVFPNGFSFRCLPANHDTAWAPSIRFVNGATHNTIRYFEATNGWRAEGFPNAPLILFDTSGAATGNSFNTIEHAVFDTDNGIRSKGSPSRPNVHNVIRENLFEYTYSRVLTIEVGTAGMEFNHNKVVLSTALNLGATARKGLALIQANYLEDTTRIAGNTIQLINDGRTDSALTAIEVAPVTTNAPAHQCLITNNYITTGASYWSAFGRIEGPGLSESTTAPVRAFSLKMNMPAHVLLAHNTVRLQPRTSNDTIRPCYSAVLSKIGNNNGGNIRVQNNILYNLRTGGGPGSLHTVLDLSDTTGMELDYNSYGRADTMARIGNALYADFAAYRTGFSSQETHSNDAPVLFEAVETPYLSAMMVGDPAIAGQPLPAVTDDINGHTRIQPYRGADEPANICDTTSYLSGIYGGGSACPGKTILLYYAERSWLAPVLPAGGLIHQWQSRIITSPVYADIPGANTTELVTTQSQYTVYRVKDSCIGTGVVTYTNLIGVPMDSSSIVFDSITVVPVTSVIYRLTVHHAGPATNYTWLFSDGNTDFSSTKDINHWFMNPGTYTATVHADRECHDPISITFTVTAPPSSTGTIPVAGNLKVYPNPANQLLEVKSDKPIGSLMVTDLTGRMLLLQEASGSSATIRTADLPAGMYLLRMSNGKEEAKTVRFVVSH